MPWEDDDDGGITLIGFNDGRVLTDERNLVGFGPRLTGTGAEHDGAAYIAGAFVDAGLKNVAVEWYNVTCFEVERAEVSLVTFDTFKREQEVETYEHETEFIVQGYSGTRTWSDRMDDLMIIDVGDGTDDGAYADANGRAVLVNTEAVETGNLTLTDLFVMAWEAGAAANIIHNTHIHPELDFAPISFTASVEDGDHWKPLPDDYPPGQGPDIPSFMVSGPVGEEIAAKVRGQVVDPLGDSNIKIRLHVEVTVEARPLNAVTGDVVGKEEGMIILGAHHDTVYVSDGAVDNTCGVATVIEMARNMAHLRPRKTIRFATFGGEENAILGSWEYLKANMGLADNTTIYCNLDMVNVDTDRGYRVTMGATTEENVDLLRKVQRAVTDRHSWARKYEFGYYTHPLTTGSDQATFAIEGVPVAVYWGSGGIEYHTPWDTIEHIDKESLMLCGIIYGSFALLMANR
ncbi:MAG: M28 family peptidase [Thermoplasmata archaeon]|nr:M28 family peptidase [Thermoplasmata archaeon]